MTSGHHGDSHSCTLFNNFASVGNLRTLVYMINQILNVSNRGSTVKGCSTVRVFMMARGPVDQQQMAVDPILLQNTRNTNQLEKGIGKRCASIQTFP